MPSIPTDSLPPLSQPVPRAMDPMDFEATNPLPEVEERDRERYERTVEPIELPPTRSPAPETIPAIGAVSAQATPTTVDVPPELLRRRRALLTAFFGIYGFAAVGAFVWGVSWPALVGFALLAYVGMLAHEIVLHRMLAHRAFRTSRAFRFAATAFAMMWPARSPIWWAATHRHHHKFADTDQDVHSPRHGAWRALIGWPFEPRSLAFPYREVGDLTRLPEMQLLDRFIMLPFAVSLALATLAGWAFGQMFPATGMTAMQGLVWWGLWRALYPIFAMGLVNVFAHRPGMGTRRYETDDDTRNVRWLSWLTAGAGWHNNHHHYGHAARAGFAPGEFDPSWWLIGQLDKMGLVWDVRDVPRAVIDGAHEEPEDD